MSHSGKSHGPMYVTVWLLLLLLTAITVITATFDFGAMNIVIAMLIASVKASLVLLYFMHLIDDNLLNKVVIGSSLFFLLLFVGLTGADLFYRTPVVQTTPVSEFGAPVDLPADIALYRTATPELIAAGKTVFAAQCATCHGAEGKGNGSASTPPPRNFTATDGWRFGRTPLAMFKTLTNGSPGTSMASYQGVLPVKDRWAVIHYVRSTLMPTPPDDSADDLAKLASGSGVEPPKARIPLSLALEKVAQVEPAAAPMESGEVQGKGPGAELYAEFCASCHGPTGNGGKKVGKLGVAPYAYQYVAPLQKNTTGWISSKDAFIHIVATGLPGKTKPAIAHFTSDEWDALYTFVKALP